MSKWTKLYEQLLADPNRIISFRNFEGLLEIFGFVHRRSKGSHRSFRHPKVPSVLTIQPRGKDALRYQVDDFLEMVRQFDLHMDE